MSGVQEKRKALRRIRMRQKRNTWQEVFMVKLKTQLLWRKVRYEEETIKTWNSQPMNNDGQETADWKSGV